jgi:hypothetical protein
MLPGIRTLHLRPARQPGHLHQLRRHVRTVHTTRLRHRRNPIRQILPHHRLRRRGRSRRWCRCRLNRLRLRLHRRRRSRLHRRLRHRWPLHRRSRRSRRRRQINVRIVRIPLNHLHRLRLHLPASRPTRPHLTTPHRRHIPRRRRLIIRTLHPTIPIPRRRRRRERIPSTSLIPPTRTQAKHGKAADHNHGYKRTGGIRRRVNFHGREGSQISPTITYPQPLASHSCIRIPPSRRGLSNYSPATHSPAPSFHCHTPPHPRPPPRRGLSHYSTQGRPTLLAGLVSSSARKDSAKRSAAA